MTTPCMLYAGTVASSYVSTLCQPLQVHCNGEFRSLKANHCAALYGLLRRESATRAWFLVDRVVSAPSTLCCRARHQHQAVSAATSRHRWGVTLVNTMAAATEPHVLYQGVNKHSAGYKLLTSMGWKEGEGLVRARSPSPCLWMLCHCDDISGSILVCSNSSLAVHRIRASLIAFLSPCAGCAGGEQARNQNTCQGQEETRCFGRGCGKCGELVIDGSDTPCHGKRHDD